MAKQHEPVLPFAEEDGTWTFTDSKGFDHKGYANEAEAWQAYDEFEDDEE